jgi:K+-sensing histidine kinase KdpD
VILDQAKRRSIGLGVLVSTATVGAGTLICWSVFRDSLADIVMVFLLGVVIMAVRFGYLASLLTTVLSVAALDFFFTAPYFSFAVADRRLVLTIVIMGFVSWVISNQTERLRRVSREARDRAADAHRAELEVQKERLKNALLSSVSHDLRTPLAVVKGAATALLDGERDLPEGRRREYLQTISQEANRLNRLVQNLVGMTALEAGPLRVRKEWQPLEEVIGVSLNRFGEQLDQRTIQVRISPDASFVPFDAILLEQVFVNLVENALKYTPAHSRIEITTKAVPRGVEVEVADTGPGVPAGQEEAIFDKFNRAGATESGMGVGLTICRGILTAHDGRIWCEKRRDGGASFRFVLPREEGSEPTNPLPELKSESSNGSSYSSGGRPEGEPL